MQTIMRYTLKLTAVLLLVTALFSSGLSTVTSAAALCSPTVSFNLWAKTGTATLYGSTTATIWGYAASASDPAAIPGPVLDVTEGACVGVTLTNNLSENTSLLFQGQEMIPDTTGVAPGGSNTYTFTATKPGTYVYEAGLIPGSQHQAAMGLYGTLIVRPTGAPTQAYGGTSTAFDSEQVVVLSELDTALNNSATPASFDMRKYAPKYFLINGKAYPGTASLSGTIGKKVLLRYVNAGLQSHAMSLLGLTQNVVGTDGNPFAFSHKMVSETIAPGQTLDAIISIPGTVAAGSKFALYDSNMLLRNNTGVTTFAGLGGMLTTLNVSASSSGGGGDPSGPVTSTVALSPNPANGTVDVTVTASVSDVTTGGSNIQAAEFYVDNTAGLPIAMSAVDLAFDSPTESVTGTLPIATLTTLASGNHTIYVRGQDVGNSWGAFDTAVLSLEKAGPLLSSLSLSPNPTTGLVSVALSFTANDSTTGNSNVTAAEYWIDGDITHTSIPVGSPATVVNLNATISSSIMSLLSAGTHVVSVRAQDALGNWSATANINLVVDNTGPTTSGLSLTPNPSNGAVSVALSFTANDSASGNSNVTAAEYFIDPVGIPAPGSGTAITVSSPAPVKTINATIPSGLGAGSHVISVRSKDALNNWGALANINLLVDNAGPAVSGVSATPNPNNGTLGLNSSVQAVRVSATFSDAASGGANISNAEGFLDVAGTTGTGFVFIANDGNFNSTTESGFLDIPLVVVNALSNGTHPICVHAKDAAGNWSSFNCTYQLIIDKLPPTVSGASLTPAASNNTAVVISANATDVATGNSNIVAGEYFIDSVGAAGTGASMTPVVVSPSTSISATIPAATVGALTVGNHTVYVRAKDAAGNWSTSTSNATLLIDRTPPTFSGITLTPSSIPAGTATVALAVTGSSDGAGGSGVSGGEYWVCPSTCTNPAAGSGTAFSGLSVNIPTALLTGGHQYTVRARIRDVAGNWSTGGNGVRSAVLTVTPANNIFTNGFEAGSLLGGWTSRSTTTTSRLNVTSGSALFGAFGLQAQGNNTNYVQNDFSPSAAAFDARFFFNPNNNSSSGGHDILAAATSSGFGTQLFHVRYRRNGSQPQVQIQVGATANAAWVNINNNASNRIEAVWQSGTTLQLYVNGTLSQTLTAGAGSVASVRLGSVTNGGSSTLEFFDAFTSKSTASPLLP
jgi:FtsP/CotA-like multicopper oxidase with cupredoxin domain